MRHSGGSPRTERVHPREDEAPQSRGQVDWTSVRRGLPEHLEPRQPHITHWRIGPGIGLWCRRDHPQPRRGRGVAGELETLNSVPSWPAFTRVVVSIHDRQRELDVDREATEPFPTSARLHRRTAADELAKDAQFISRLWCAARASPPRPPTLPDQPASKGAFRNRCATLSYDLPNARTR